MTVHVPTLLEGILEATAAEAAAKARITTLRAALEDEARRRFTADGAAPSWNAPQLGKVRLDPASEWSPVVADEVEFGTYVAQHHPTEATVIVELNAADAADVVQALEFIGVTPVSSRVVVRPAWADAYLKGLALDVTEERDASAQVTRTVIAADQHTGNVIPGIGVTRSEAKLVVSLDRDRRTAAVQEARSTATALVEASSDDDEGRAARTALAALDVRRRQLEGLHADQLATMAQAHGLGRSGSKAALAERIARAEAATGLIVNPASTVETPSPLPEGTEVEEVTTLPAHEAEPDERTLPDPDGSNGIAPTVADYVDQPVEEVPDGGDVVDVIEESAEQEAATLDHRDPRTAGYVASLDVPAEADLVEDLGSREVLRKLAKRLDVSAAGTKVDVATRLVQAGHTATTLKELLA